MGLGGAARGAARSEGSIAMASETGKGARLRERRNRMATAETRALERRGRVGEPNGRLELEPREHRPDEAAVEEIARARRVDGSYRMPRDADHSAARSDQ